MHIHRDFLVTYLELNLTFTSAFDVGLAGLGCVAGQSEGGRLADVWWVGVEREGRGAPEQ